MRMLEGARKKRRKSPRRKSKDRQSVSSDKIEDFPDINVRWLYVFFLSARNLHVPAAVCLALASSVGLSTLSMTFGTPYTTAVIVPLLAVVCLEIAWFCFFRPAGLCPVWKKLFSVSRGEIPELSCKFFEEAQNIHRKLRYSNDRPGGGGLPAPRRLLPARRAARGSVP